MDLISIIAAAVVTVIVIWLALVVVLWLNRPSRDLAMTVMRMLPDVLRLTGRLIVDPATPRSARLALVFLGGWIAMPLDLVPDFLPVIGQLDDVVVAVLVLRWVGRRVGETKMRTLWSGSTEGWELLSRALGWSA